MRLSNYSKSKLYVILQKFLQNIEKKIECHLKKFLLLNLENNLDFEFWKKLNNELSNQLNILKESFLQILFIEKNQKEPFKRFSNNVEYIVKNLKELISILLIQTDKFLLNR